MRHEYSFAQEVGEPVRERAMRCLEGWDFFDAGSRLEIEPLSGGANNVNLIVSRDGARWALKLRDPLSQDYNNAAIVEAIAGQKEAAALGVAPEILEVSEEGDFLSDFVVGETLRPDGIRSRRRAPEMVDALRKLHRSKLHQRELSLFEDTRVFLRGAEKANGTVPGDFFPIWELAQEFETALRRASPPMSFVHGDLVPQNFIACEDGMMLVDFDYCGFAYTAVDLACATSQAEMSAEETEQFLRLYDPDLDDGQRARVAALQFVNSLREVSWACMAEPHVGGVTTLMDGWSYEYHRNHNLEIARRFAGSPDTPGLLDAVGQVRSGALF